MSYNKYQSEWARARQAKNEKLPFWVKVALIIAFVLLLYPKIYLK